MKKILLLSACIILLLFGCGKAASPNLQNVDIESTQATTQKQDSSQPKNISFADEISDNTTENYSPNVANCYASYKEIVNNIFPQYSLSSIEEDTVNYSKFYSFNLNTNEGYSQPKITFQNEEASFKISLPDEIDNNILKNVIVCTIMSAEKGTDRNSANKIMQNLVNSFDGSKNSEVFSTTNYKFYISAGSGITLRYLNVISVSEINSFINVDEYVQATNELFYGELNQGTKAYLNGTVLGIHNLGTHFGLEIKSGSDIYVIYYNFDNFLDCFEVGNTYTFYGQIATSREGYAGCLRLDYYSSED